MIQVQSTFRTSADPEAADLVTGGDSTAVGAAVADALTAAVADGSLVLPS